MAADDDQIVQRAPNAPGHPNQRFADDLSAIIIKTRTSSADLGSGITALKRWRWNSSHINIATAQMAELYADLALQQAEDEGLKKWGVRVEDVLPTEHVVRKPRRYGDTLRDYRVKMEEVAGQIGVVRSGMFILQEALEKVRAGKLELKPEPEARRVGP